MGISERYVESLERLRRIERRGLPRSVDTGTRRRNLLTALDDALMWVCGLITSPIAANNGRSLRQLRRNILQVRRIFESSSDPAAFHRIVDQMARLGDDVKSAGLPRFPDIKGKVPAEVWEQMIADYEEVEKSYWAGSYRASIAFAARILESALGLRYMRKTHKDPVSMDWTLGKLVAEAESEGLLGDVNFPGTEYFLRFLNKSRIASVHVKSGRPYQPDNQQARLLIEMALSISKNLST